MQAKNTKPCVFAAKLSLLPYAVCKIVVFAWRVLVATSYRNIGQSGLTVRGIRSVAVYAILQSIKAKTVKISAILPNFDQKQPQI